MLKVPESWKMVVFLLPPASRSRDPEALDKRTSMDRQQRMQSAATRLVACGPTGARAIDILVASVTKVLAEPHKERYRIVDPSHPAMHPLAEARGGTEFLWAIGYEPVHGHLVLQRHDPAQLRAGLDVLAR